MKIEKKELVKMINRLKPAVPSKALFPVLEGILIKDGWMIANNTVVAVKLKADDVTGETFIIPSAAFGLINSLPAGDMEIIPEEKNGAYAIKVSSGRITNTYRTFAPDDFPVPDDTYDGSSAVVMDSDVLIRSIKRVSYAVSPLVANRVMNSLYMKSEAGRLDVVATDGHMLAWDVMDFNGSFSMMIPKDSVDRLLALGLRGDVHICCTSNSAVFMTEELVIHTRLTEGTYFRFEDLFNKPLTVKAGTDRQALLEAASRAKLVTTVRLAARLEIKGSELNISIKDEMSDYSETLNLTEQVDRDIVISLDPRYLAETLKAFDEGDIHMDLENGRMPVVLWQKEDGFRAMITPVMTK